MLIVAVLEVAVAVGLGWWAWWLSRKTLAVRRRERFAHRVDMALRMPED